MTRNRTMSRAEWPGIPEREYAFCPFSAFGLRGEAGLLFMRTVARPMRVKSFDKHIFVVKQGYTWLQLAPENERFWATVMFDEQGELFQYYFDITRANTVCPRGESSFIDLYLDIVMRPGGETRLLDRAELDAALNDGIIDLPEYKTALKAAERVLRLLEGREGEWRAYCTELRGKLITEMRIAL